MISFQDFTFTYSDAPRPSLSNISLDIKDSEFVLITGPSGSGKSSLLRCINGLIPHFHGGTISGRVMVQGLEAGRHSTKELATIASMVFQDPENQLVTADVEREISFGLENLGFPRQIIAKRLEESLDTLNIAHLRYRRVHDLSGGEKQKVALASVLALHPEILLMDEPTSELDPKGAEEVLSIVSRLNDELGITILLVEHRLERVIHLVDRMIVMDEGAIIIDGAPRQIFVYKGIEETGIGLPPLARLFQGLQSRGIPIRDTPLTVKEGRITLSQWFSNGHRHIDLNEASRNKAYSTSLESPPDKTHGRLFSKRNFFTPFSKGGKRNLNSRLESEIPMVGIEKLWFTYGDGPAVLKDVSLTFSSGEFVAIMGRNASGKTTLVKHINGLLRPRKGSVTSLGIDTKKTTVAELAKRIGFVFQNPNDHLFAETVEEECAFTLSNLGYQHGEVKDRIDEVLEQFGLAHRRYDYPRSLSGGEKQRVALASVLVAKPEILILDEPTRGMEERLKRELMTFLGEYCKRGNTVLLVTHDVEMAAEYTERVILMSEGQVVVEGSSREVLSQALLFSPQINRLTQAFVKHGVPTDILTVDEALAYITGDGSQLHS